MSKKSKEKRGGQKPQQDITTVDIKVLLLLPLHSTLFLPLPALISQQEEHCLTVIVTRAPVHCICVANGFVYCGAWDNNVQQYDVKVCPSISFY